MKKLIIWWGRSDNNYSRNQLIRKLLFNLGYQIINFIPLISSFGHIEANFRLDCKPNLIWVPCFRHRDVISASIWARKNNIPLIFDPLISSWDKQINERKKFTVNSYESKKIKNYETKIFNMADVLIADTHNHKHFFHKNFNVPLNNINVLLVGADQAIFKPLKKTSDINNEVLFYGSDLELHGISTIIKAAKITKDKSIKWVLIGNFKRYSDINNIIIEKSIPYKNLPNRISKSKILLGIFSGSEKAGNVIPNKVYQSMACGKPIITRKSSSYPKSILNKKNGIFFIDPGKPEQLSKNVTNLIYNEKKIFDAGKLSRKFFMKYFSEKVIEKQLKEILKKVNIN